MGNKYYFDLICKALKNAVAIKSDVSPSTDLTKDLQVDSDDIIFLLIPYLEKVINNKIPNDEWAKVSTLEQISALLSKYDNSKK